MADLEAEYGSIMKKKPSQKADPKTIIMIDVPDTRRPLIDLMDQVIEANPDQVVGSKPEESKPRAFQIGTRFLCTADISYAKRRFIIIAIRPVKDFKIVVCHDEMETENRGAKTRFGFHIKTLEQYLEADKLILL